MTTLLIAFYLYQTVTGDTIYQRNFNPETLQG